MNNSIDEIEKKCPNMNAYYYLLSTLEETWKLHDGSLDYEFQVP